MPSGQFTLFGKNKDDLRINDLVGATIKIALVTSAYTPDVNSATGHSVFADVSANEIAAGNGYVAGGGTPGTNAATAISNGFKFSTADMVFTAAGGSIPAWRYAVLYVSGNLWGMTNPLIGYFLGDSTPADIPATTDTNNCTLACPAAGWFDEV